MKNKALIFIKSSIGQGHLEVKNFEKVLHKPGNIQNGVLNITAGDDAIRGNSAVQIDGGNINIETCMEGIEATFVQINGGTINVNARSAFDANIQASLLGGDVTVNGQAVTEIRAERWGRGGGRW